jgi:hypothetical protein
MGCDTVVDGKVAEPGLYPRYEEIAVGLDGTLD